MIFQATGLITLTTDFGLRDPYVGIMKGAILCRFPDARLIDLTHEAPTYQPQLAGFWLSRAWPHFPAGTVHLAVVDPGVGTQRAMVLLEFAGQVFIAPDNGLLDTVPGDAPDPQWRMFGADDLVHLQLRAASNTFHGRDIFAPLVAEIAAGRQRPDSLGTRLRRAPARIDCNRDYGQILWADHYGNLVTDIAAERLRLFRHPALLFRQQRIELKPSYGYAQQGELLALVNSWGTLEIAEAQGNARQRLQATPGEVVQLVETA